MRIPVADPVLPAAQLGRVHLIGIGGAGLSAIARLLHGLGVPVQGSDAADTDTTRALRAEGIECFVGHDGARLEGVDTVIASTAVREDNPEIVESQRRGLRLWPRSSGLMATMTDDRRIAVAGTHGKTTTTAMLTCALRGAGVDPSFAIGARVASLGTNARRGTSPEFVVEADESDGAFLHYAPDLAIITNVDADHLDTWGTVEAYEAAFAEFIDTVTGSLVVCADDAIAVRLAAAARVPVSTAGFDAGADVRGAGLSVSGTRSTFTVTAGERTATVLLEVPGEHYARDALLAIAAGLDLGLDLDRLVAGLATYTGADRRMQFLGERAGIAVYDSYAHHPSEIAADVAAGRGLAGGRRLVVCFQPHLVSRTRLFGTQMGEALSAADLVGVVDLYLAREDPDPLVTSALVADAVRATPVSLLGAVERAHEALADLVRPGDVVLTLGAGDVTDVGPRLLEAVAHG